MINCKEFVLDDVISITAIPVADFSLGDKEWQVTPTIPRSEVDLPSFGIITIGMQHAGTGDILIPIVKTTGKAKDETSDSVAGRLHTVTVTCQIDERENSVWDSLLILERTPSHLILTFRDASMAFVAATQDSYLCEVGRDGASTSVQFRIQNYMGVQMML